MDSSIEAAVSRVNCFRCPISGLVDFDDLSRVFQSSITHETYRDIPSAYLLNTKDQAFRYEYQLKTVQRAGITVTKILETGHSPFLTRPEEVKDFVVSFVAGLNI